MTTLDLFRDDLATRTAQVASLHPSELRRRAVKAAGEKDVEGLWTLTEAFLTTHGVTGARVSGRTLKVYGEAVRAFLGYATENAVDLLKPGGSVGALYLRSLEASGKSPATVRVKLAGARTLYKALRWAEATTADPFTDARPAREVTAAWDKRQPYTEAETGLLLGAADDRMKALLLLCGHAGLRIAEALSLTWADIDLGGRSLIVRSGKGGKTRRVTLSRSLVEALEALENREGAVIGGGAESARERLAWLCKRAGVQNRGFHALRHYAGTRLVREGHSLETAAQHLGHASIETTRIYTKWSDDSLKDALGDW